MDTKVKLQIDRILNMVAEKQASDLHLSVGSVPTLRIHNQLLPLEQEESVTKEFMDSFVETILDSDQKKILTEKKELVIAYQLNRQIRFRINIFFQKSVLAAYLRLIGSAIIPLPKLGLPISLEQIAEKNKGLIIISGSFGSGKTTTSASIIDHINHTRSSYILTIEKPIEYIFSNHKSIIEQREVGRDAISFEQALSSITQEDVDILYISELSSKKIINSVINIATSGRLVIANVEADTTVKTLEFIIDSFPSNEQQRVRAQLSTNLAGIVCQRLVPRVGGGQVAIAEIMTATPPIQSIIKEGSLYQISNVIQTSREEGMVSLDWSLAELVKTNEINLESALDNASDQQQLRYMLRA